MEGVYKGELKDGVRHGAGTLEWINGDKYEGDFKDGFRDGEGVLVLQVM
jgi:hypothetical protein